MDQTQTIDNQASVDNDLQKAIDDITNTTNIDPVFSDPVAAPSSVPEGDTGELGEPVGPFPEPKVATVTEAPAPMAPLESMDIPELNNFQLPPAPEVPAAPAPVIEQPMPDPIPQSLSTGEVKKAALRDLVPLLDKINMNSSEKFSIYRDIFDDLKDYTVLDPAYRAAREIPDETERANALLYLIKSIDRM